MGISLYMGIIPRPRNRYTIVAKFAYFVSDTYNLSIKWMSILQRRIGRLGEILQVTMEASSVDDGSLTPPLSPMLLDSEDFLDSFPYPTSPPKEIRGKMSRNTSHVSGGKSRSQADWMMKHVKCIVYLILCTIVKCDIPYNVHYCQSYTTLILCSLNTGVYMYM